MKKAKINIAKLQLNKTAIAPLEDTAQVKGGLPIFSVQGYTCQKTYQDNCIKHSRDTDVSICLCLATQIAC
ncbi:class I lanthipeptide [Taibaiella koreensis]|uniref:class I lanthipeptide n=1 Tax=Taibaiella koreensis TaxID=1268548 RepID=UPI000E59D148|nr:class I lanthipeptide [Taibaiella koreensis]